MSKIFKTIAILGRYTDQRVAEPMHALSSHLLNAGISVIASPEVASAIGARGVAERSFAAEADLIIAVGGDGTMLYAAELSREGDIPLLGVNRGRLGFLADVSPVDMLQSLDKVLNGNYSKESRLLLTARIAASDGTIRSAMALNDVVLQRRDTGRMLDFETRIANMYVNTHSGDGLIVATPTGSTAYALSCGGPIIEPILDAVVVVPICPHTLSDRPIVIPASLSIEIQLLKREDTSAEITADGHSMGSFEAEDILTISKSDKHITLIHPPGYDYYEILRSKLHWGRDSRIRSDSERHGKR